MFDGKAGRVSLASITFPSNRNRLMMFRNDFFRHWRAAKGNKFLARIFVIFHDLHKIQRFFHPLSWAITQYERCLSETSCNFPAETQHVVKNLNFIISFFQQITSFANPPKRFYWFLSLKNRHLQWCLFDYLTMELKNEREMLETEVIFEKDNENSLAVDELKHKGLEVLRACCEF